MRYKKQSRSITERNTKFLDTTIVEMDVFIISTGKMEWNTQDTTESCSLMC